MDIMHRVRTIGRWRPNRAEHHGGKYRPSKPRATVAVITVDDQLQLLLAALATNIACGDAELRSGKTDATLRGLLPGVRRDERQRRLTEVVALTRAVLKDQTQEAYSALDAAVKAFFADGNGSSWNRAVGQ